MRPARLALLTLLAALPLALPASPARADDLVYVLNSGEATISVLNAETRELVRRIPMLREPHHLVNTPDGSQIVIGDSAGNELLFLDATTGDFRRRERISDPYHLAYSPDGKWLVIAAIKRDQIDIYDAATLQLVHRIDGVSQPSHLDYSPDSKTVYVTLQGQRGLVAVDIAEGRQLWTANVGPQPAGVLLWNGRLFVGVMGADYVAVVDPANGNVERRLPTAKGSHTVFLSPDRRRLYATSRVDSRITVFNAETLVQEAQWRIPGGPDDITFARDGRLWATLRWAQKVAVIDPQTGLFETVAVGRSPHGILVQRVPATGPAPTATGTAQPVQQARNN
ncbi:YncE family protein [Roseomonas sp. NAR14]|uniref:YncE family protein n=1 Tax=Roseomonas acroporae TaxID=2937791 RepID=A0A9X1YAB4_9PROT|nr:YncE family protein [Roseomonas acroporae]MCK8785012.1 YncE family protein [Roseomonas acroporae]